MTKPIDKLDFWQARLSMAIATGDLRDAVYRTTAQTWVNIDLTHKRLLERHIGPLDTVLDAGCGYGRTVGLIKCSRYVGVDQVPEFIVEAGNLTIPVSPFLPDPEIYEFYCLPLEELPFPDNEFDWVVGISLMVMVIANLGWDKWNTIQTELLRVSKKGLLMLEYTDPEVHYVIKKS